VNGSGRPPQRGQSFVEFALILPVLLLLVLMALDLGRVFLAAVTINNTARIGARYAAAYPEAWGATPDPVRQAEYEARIAAEWADIDCTQQSPIPGPVFSGTKEIGQPVAVTLTCSFNVITPLIGDIIGNTLVLTGEATIPITSCSSTTATPGSGNEACVAPPTQPPPPTPTPTPDPCVAAPSFQATPLNHTALAGTTMSYNVAFTNNDSAPCLDRVVTFSAVVNTGTPGWTAVFAQNTFTLPPGASANTTMDVTSPVGAPTGSTTITVEATGATDQSVGYIVQTCGQAPALSANPTTNSGPPNFGQIFTITLQNNDPAACPARSFTFSATVPGPNAGNWATAFLPPTLNNVAAGGATATTTLTVTPNSSATGFKDIAVTTDLGGSTTVRATLVPCTQAPTLSANPTTNAGPPNAGQAFTITLFNNDPLGCAPRAFTFSASVPNPQPQNWATSFSPNPITVAAQATGPTTLTVTPNSSASGSKDIDVTTNSGGNVVVTATVAQCNQNPTVSAAPASHIGAPGVARQWTIMVTNPDPAACGSRLFTIDANFQGNSTGWVKTFSPGTLTLAGGASGTSTMTITSPAGASSNQNITPTANGTTGNPVTYIVQACTNNQPTVSAAPASQSGNPGETRTYIVTVTNNDSAGCADRTFSFTTTAPSNNWTVPFPAALTLAPGATGSRDLNVTPDNTVTAGNYNVSVTTAAITRTVEYVVLTPTPPPPTPSPTPSPTPTPTDTPAPTDTPVPTDTPSPSPTP
jgi:hypothetical protein